MSYLFRAVTTSANNQAGLILYDGAVSTAKQVLYLGVPTGGSTLGLFATANAAPPLGASALSQIVATNQRTLFVVIKMMFGTANGDRVFMYVNPPLVSEPTNNVYNAAVLNNLTFQFDRLLFASGATTTTVSFDEFRLGETFADVVPLAPDRYVVTELASLPAPAPGGYSISPLLQDAQGRLYGARLTGGAGGSGVVFKLGRAGSQPNAAVTLVPSVGAGGNTFQLSFTGVPLGRYEIQSTGQLPSGWQTLSNVQADGNGQVQFMEAILMGTTRRFYRVVNH